MIPIERQQRLVELLRLEPGLAVVDLARRLAVSAGTVRNDLHTLAEAGQVVRVRGGGTVLPQTPTFPGSNFMTRARENEAAKRAIGRRAADLVSDGDSLLLDASTSAYHLAQHLQINHHNLRVVTNGIEVAHLLSQNPTHLVMLVGGILRSGTQSVTGPWSMRFLEEVCTQLAFVSCSGFTPESGMTEVDIYEAEFRVKAIDVATRVVGLIDSSKFGKTDLTPSVRPERLSCIFSDTGLSSEWAVRLDRVGISYTLCE